MRNAARPLTLLTQRRMVTLESCQQGWPGLAYVEFASTNDVAEFLNVAQRHYRVEVETWDEEPR